MAKIQPFEEHTSQYEHWFEVHSLIYQAEVAALKLLLPPFERAVEIGVGSGRFAVPLKIPYGLEPSRKMGTIARQRGIDIQIGVAEALPYRSNCLDLVLMATTICFLDDVAAALRETYRVLRPGQFLLLGFIDRESPVGRIYQKFKEKNVFYRVATFFSVTEVKHHLQQAGFKNFQFAQTIFHKLEDIHEIESPQPGYGNGSFVVIRAQKPEEDSE